MNNQDNHQHLNDEQQQPYLDFEQQEGGDIQSMMRLVFILKVYGIISFLLLIIVSICSLTFFDNENKFFVSNPAIFWKFILINFVIYNFVICC